MPIGLLNEFSGFGSMEDYLRSLGENPGAYNEPQIGPGDGDPNIFNPVQIGDPNFQIPGYMDDLGAVGGYGQYPNGQYGVYDKTPPNGTNVDFGVNHGSLAPNNTTVFDSGGLWGTGIDIGIPGVASIGGIGTTIGLGGLLGMDGPGMGAGGLVGVDTGGSGGMLGVGEGGGNFGLGGGTLGGLLGGGGSGGGAPMDETTTTVPPVVGTGTVSQGGAGPAWPAPPGKIDVGGGIYVDDPNATTVPPVIGTGGISQNGAGVAYPAPIGKIDAGGGIFIDDPNTTKTVPPVTGGGGQGGTTTVPPFLVTTPTETHGMATENPPNITIPPVITTGGGGGTPTTTPTNGPITIPVTPPLQPTTPMPEPLDRNYYREGNQTSQDFGLLGPGIYNNYAQYSGQYGNADMANYQALLSALGLSNNQLTGVANQQTAASNTALRTGNVADAQNLSPTALGLLQQLNPNMYGALNQAQTASGTAGQPSDIQTTLEQQAREGLALGTQLSPEDIRNAQQAAREAWSARGLVNSNGAIGAEILNRDALGRQRLQERQGLAAAVDQQGFGQRQSGYTNVLQNAQLQAQNRFDPFATITSANTQNQGTNQNLFGNAVGFSSGAFGNQNVNNLVNPFNPYSQDVYNSNFNADNARYISSGNNAAALQGANSAANGQIANSFLNLIGQIYKPSCWVARAVYGDNNPAWMKFRDWLMADAPEELMRLYIRCGRDAANWLEENPEFKPEIRAFMDSKIAA